MAGRFAKSISLTVSTALSFITGDIQVFQACVQLVELNLDKTYVQGDIQAFQATRKLASLKLHGTHVFGELAAFRRRRRAGTVGLTIKDLETTYIYISNYMYCISYFFNISTDNLRAPILVSRFDKIGFDRLFIHKWSTQKGEKVRDVTNMTKTWENKRTTW